MDLKEEQKKIWIKKSRNELDKYWNDKRSNSRSKWFVNKLKGIKFDSIYEVGAFSGRNLFYIYNSFPDVKIGGADLDEYILKYAKKKVPNVQLDVSDIYSLDTNDKWDIVFTMGVLIHIPLGDIQKAISMCVKKSKKYVIHLECHGRNKCLKRNGYITCVHDLRSAYKNLGLDVKIINIGKESGFEGVKSFCFVDVTSKKIIDD